MMQVGVRRDCWECGRLCESCEAIYTKKCRNNRCRTVFCVVHDPDCTSNEACIPHL